MQHFASVKINYLVTMVRMVVLSLIFIVKMVYLYLPHRREKYGTQTGL